MTVRTRGNIRRQKSRLEFPLLAMCLTGYISFIMDMRETFVHSVATRSRTHHLQGQLQFIAINGTGARAPYERRLWITKSA